MALARGVGQWDTQTRAYVRGSRVPSLQVAVRMSERLRVPLADVAFACLEARREWLERQGVEEARREAMRE